VLLDNIYRLTHVIKEGGMGFVYKAVDAAGAEYAIKEMRDNFATEDERKEGIERFIEEAELLHNLNHPAIPQVYRSFIDEGRYYLSMEFIYGEDLEEVLKREKRFPEPVVLRWADQLCDVLEYMHSAGLIYRDMKPANIMIDRDGNVKLVDFGIAKLLRPGQRNTMVGTPGYAPPEQYQGLATVESDIYALAATLHHLLTGRDPRDHPPFTFPPANTFNRAISAQTTKALEKALSMEVAERFHSADAFRRALPIPTGDRRPTLPFDLGRDVDRQPARMPAAQAQPPAPSRAAPPAPPRRRGRVRRVVAAVLLAVALAGTGVAVTPGALPALQNFVTNLVSAVNPGAR
jgi:serine/threonine-protein kinase